MSLFRFPCERQSSLTRPFAQIVQKHLMSILSSLPTHSTSLSFALHTHFSPSPPLFRHNSPPLHSSRKDSFLTMIPRSPSVCLRRFRINCVMSFSDVKTTLTNRSERTEWRGERGKSRVVLFSQCWFGTIVWSRLYLSVCCCDCFGPVQEKCCVHQKVRFFALPPSSFVAAG